MRRRAVVRGDRASGPSLAEHPQQRDHGPDDHARLEQHGAVEVRAEHGEVRLGRVEQSRPAPGARVPGPATASNSGLMCGV